MRALAPVVPGVRKRPRLIGLPLTPAEVAAAAAAQPPPPPPVVACKKWVTVNGAFLFTVTETSPGPAWRRDPAGDIC